MKRLLLFILIALCLVVPAKTYAAEDFTITTFDSNLTVEPEGTVVVEENITVDFTSYKHGIFRDIPFEYTQDNKEPLYTTIDVLSVMRDNQEENYQTTITNGNVELKIGNAGKTIIGEHTYEIKYKVTGILLGFEGYDELFWNATGNNWPVPIKKASATVTLPQPAVVQITCYQGGFGSKTNCANSSSTDTTATFTSGYLNPGEGLTIVVGYTKGLVPLLVVSRSDNASDSSSLQFGLFDLIIFLLFSAGGVGLALWLWYKRGRDEKGGHETIVAEFESPQKMRPAELGVLIDERADTLDVTATIIDLAVRGFVNIKEIPKKWIFGSVDYELSKTEKKITGLLSYEKELFDKLFADSSTVKTSDLKTTFYASLEAVKKKLYEDVVEKKLFPADPAKARNEYMVAGIVLMVGGGVGMFVGLFMALLSGLLFALSAALLVSGLAFLLVSRSMGSRTKEGREMYRRAKGYELFIDTAEKYRQQFFEKKNLFNEILPYAIVLGSTEKFAKAFADMGIKPQTSWYSSSSGQFNTIAFGSHVSTFSRSFSAAIVATAPKGSGFGGGGGGSW